MYFREHKDLQIKSLDKSKLESQIIQSVRSRDVWKFVFGDNENSNNLQKISEYIQKKIEFTTCEEKKSPKNLKQDIKKAIKADNSSIKDNSIWLLFDMIDKTTVSMLEQATGIAGMKR